MSDPSLTQKFKDVTGVTNDELACYVLEASGFDLESAVMLYSSGAFAEDQIPRNETSDYSAGGSVRKVRDIYDEDGLRVADQIKRQRLVDESRRSDYHHHSMATRKTTPHNVFQAASYDHVHGRGSSSGNSSASNANAGNDLTDKEKTLQKMFSPPTDLLWPGDFDSALKKCHPSPSLGWGPDGDSKWLLVNIQKNEEFASHELNRDVWSHEMVKDVLYSKFVFWQQLYDDDKNGGSTFVRNYRIASHLFPYVCIIDPRTGAEVWTWKHRKVKSKVLPNHIPVQDILQEFTDFLCTRPTPGSGSGPSAGPNATPANSHPSSVAGSQVEIGGEDEELRRALALSAAEAQARVQAQAQESGSIAEEAVAISFSAPESVVSTASCNDEEPTCTTSTVEGSSRNDSQAFCAVDKFFISSFYNETVSSADATSGERLLKSSARPSKMKIQFPSKTVVVELSEDATVKSLLQCIVAELLKTSTELDFKFDVTFGHPVKSLRDVLNGSDLVDVHIDSSLDRVGINPGDKMRVVKL